MIIIEISCFLFFFKCVFAGENVEAIWWVAGQHVCEPADLVSVKQLGLLATYSEAEQVADHQLQASPLSLGRTLHQGSDRHVLFKWNIQL